MVSKIKKHLMGLTQSTMFTLTIILALILRVQAHSEYILCSPLFFMYHCSLKVRTMKNLPPETASGAYFYMRGTFMPGVIFKVY